MNASDKKVDRKDVNVVAIDEVALEHAAYAIRMSNSSPVECIAPSHTMCDDSDGCVCRHLAEAAMKSYMAFAESR